MAFQVGQRWRSTTSGRRALLAMPVVTFNITHKAQDIRVIIASANLGIVGQEDSEHLFGSCPLEHTQPPGDHPDGVSRDW